MTYTRSQWIELEYKRQDERERANSILRQSPPILREKIHCIRDYFEDEFRRTIVGRYQVAVILRDICEDVNENNGTVYGAKAVEAITYFFGWEKSLIYQALHVAEAFTPEEIEAIAQMRSPDGMPLSFSHVVALATVEDKKKRQQLLKQTAQAAWTTRKLFNAVRLLKAASQGNRPDGRGRPLAVPRTFDAILEQQEDFVYDFLNRNEKVWTHIDSSLTSRAHDLASDDYTQERADRLKYLADQMALLAQKAQERADEALKVYKSFWPFLAKQRDQDMTRALQVVGPFIE